MKGGSIPAVCRQHHATLRFYGKRSVARSLARSETENRQIRDKTTANTLFQLKTAPGWAELEGRDTSIALDTRSVASKCSVEVPRCYHAAVEAGARAADDHA
jgi:hypothetical protein